MSAHFSCLSYRALGELRVWVMAPLFGVGLVLFLPAPGRKLTVMRWGGQPLEPGVLDFREG